MKLNFGNFLEGRDTIFGIISSSYFSVLLVFGNLISWMVEVLD